MRKVLGSDFFERAALIVARELLGKYLVHRDKNAVIARMITETEAYIGPQDLASHSARGLTPRTRTMFGPAGCWYVYFTYGMHWMLNIVTEREGYPAAVLIRGVEGIAGPGRVSREFNITRTLDGLAAAPENDLWIEDRGIRLRDRGIKTGPRVGVAYAGPWAKKPYRFILELPLDTSRRADKLVPMAKRFVYKKSKKRSGGG